MKSHYNFICICVGVLLAAPLYADTITVHNRTDEVIFAAIYYQQSGKHAVLASDVMTLDPRAKVVVERPKRIKGRDRVLVAGRTKSALQESIDAYTLRTLASLNIGALKGSVFYFARNQGIIQGYSQSEWLLVKPTLDTAQQAIEGVQAYTTDQLKKYVQANYTAAKKNPYKKQNAAVRIGNTLCEQERNYVERRMPIVQASLEKMLAMSLKDRYIPKIACVFSGGGHRAMASTIGSLMGAQEIGLLDATTWMVGLSGSTWALGTWLVSQKPIAQFSDQLFSVMGKHITKISSDDAQLIANALIVKWAYDQPITLVDLYGALLANTFFSYKGDDCQRVYLSQQASTIATQDWPLPIFTAIQTGRNDPAPRWYEFCPFEIGSSELAMYVAPWAFGRPFLNGLSQDAAPEQTFGFLLGIFGSAFAAPIKQIHAQMMEGIKDETTKKIMEQIFDGMERVVGQESFASLGQKRITNSWAEVYNFSLGMPTSPINNQKIIRFSDAGIAFNLPYQPVSGERPERKADIIILFDYSAGIKNPTALRGIEAYAQRKGLPLPVIDYTQVSKRAISVFKDPKNSAAPVVIYIPLIRDDMLWSKVKKQPEFKRYLEQLDLFDPALCAESSFCATTNFEYTKKQAQQLAAHNAFVLKACKDEIVRAIAWVIEQK